MQTKNTYNKLSQKEKSANLREKMEKLNDIKVGCLKYI